MSFLVRRNLQKFAGWYDDFARASENPVKPPWVTLDGGPTTSLNSASGGTLFIPDNFGANIGGPSYEFQPFTPNWGFEMQISWPNGIPIGQAFAIYFTDSWTVVGPGFQDGMGIRFANNAGRSVLINHFENLSDFNPPMRTFPVTFDYPDGPFTMRLWCDGDQWCRLWVNNVYYGTWRVEAGFEFHDDRRCVRFNNNSATGASLFWLYHYDRPPLPPYRFNSWTSDFFDDFNRTTSGTVGNGWAEYGANIGILTNNSVGIEAGAGNGDRGCWQSGNPTNNGNQRIEIVLGGGVNVMQVDQDTSVLMRVNSAGTAGLIVSVTRDIISLYRWTGNLAANSFTFTLMESKNDLRAQMAVGVKYAFSVVEDTLWVSVVSTGEVIFMAWGVDTVVPNTNAYHGIKMERVSSINSPSINEYQAFSL